MHQETQKEQALEKEVTKILDSQLEQRHKTAAIMQLILRETRIAALGGETRGPEDLKLPPVALAYRTSVEEW